MLNMRYFSLAPGRQTARSLSATSALYASDGEPGVYYVVSQRVFADITIWREMKITLDRDSKPATGIYEQFARNGDIHHHRNRITKDELTRRLREHYGAQFIGDPWQFLAGDTRNGVIVNARLLLPAPETLDEKFSDWVTRTLRVSDLNVLGVAVKVSNEFVEVSDVSPAVINGPDFLRYLSLIESEAEGKAARLEGVAKQDATLQEARDAAEKHAGEMARELQDVKAALRDSDHIRLIALSERDKYRKESASAQMEINRLRGVIAQIENKARFALEAKGK